MATEPLSVPIKQLKITVCLCAVNRYGAPNGRVRGAHAVVCVKFCKMVMAVGGFGVTGAQLTP